MMPGPGRRSILRMIALLLAWLVAGATLNVAVAWGLAVKKAPLGPTPALIPMGLPLSYQEKFQVESLGIHPLPQGDDGATYHFWAIRDKYRGFEMKEIREQRITHPSDGRDETRGHSAAFALMVVAGLPRQSLGGVAWRPRLGAAFNSFEANWTSRSLWINGIGPVGAYSATILPLRPIWPGFAINTLFYAGMLWMLCCGPFALRRMIRRRRGQCAQCAYPIGTSEICTECGTPHAVKPTQAGISSRAGSA